MAKRKQQANRPQVPQRPLRVGSDTLGIATFIGVALALAISAMNLRLTDRIEEDLDRRLDRVEDRIAEVGERLASPSAPAAAPAAAPPPRRGPDPDRVYPIRTAGAPSKGPSSAPVTIAEFSDFQ